MEKEGKIFGELLSCFSVYQKNLVNKGIAKH